MKIAIAASGIGHIYRGMEGWAESMAASLHERGIQVTLFRGAGPPKYEYDICIPCLKRSSNISKRLARLNTLGAWRFGLGSPGQIEAWSYGVNLLRYLNKKYDLVHIKQGNLAEFLGLADKMKLLKIPFILSNGQIAKPDFISKYKYVQFLSAYERQVMIDSLTDSDGWFVIPNFVDTAIFKPLDKRMCRHILGVPEDAFVVSSVGAIKRYHKRMDYLLDEMALLRKRLGQSLHVILAGSKDEDTKELIEKGNYLLGKQLTVITERPKNEMPIVYNASDVFTLCSLREAFGNVYIEAMACGIPVVHHNYPVVDWITGESGYSIDLEKKCNLSNQIYSISIGKSELLNKSELAIERACKMFSKEIVVGETIRMYEKVLSINRKKMTLL